MKLTLLFDKIQGKKILETPNPKVKKKEEFLRQYVFLNCFFLSVIVDAPFTHIRYNSLSEGI